MILKKVEIRTLQIDSLNVGTTTIYKIEVYKD